MSLLNEQELRTVCKNCCIKDSRCGRHPCEYIRGVEEGCEAQHAKDQAEFQKQKQEMWDYITKHIGTCSCAECEKNKQKWGVV